MITRPRKVVLAYSGGLDTSIIVSWLVERYGCEVVTYTGDVGQQESLDGLEAKALASGASEAIIEDLRLEFVRDRGLLQLRQQLCGRNVAVVRPGGPEPGSV